MNDLIKITKQILFNTEMVKAILDGRKTQFRKHTGNYIAEDGRYEGFRNKDVELVNGIIEIHTTLARKISSKYKVGDVLWVREPAKVIEINDYQDCFTFKYLVDNKEETLSYLDKWENEDGMTVPRWVENCQGVPNGCIKEMARIFLKVTNVRVERLKDIKYSDMEKEGVSYKDFLVKEGVSINEQFQRNWVNLWNSTAKDGYKWENNPYVFVYEFKRVEK